MKSRQAEHKKLTEEQIKEHICDLTVELHHFKEDLRESVSMLQDQIETMEQRIELLKRHFCPEKFMVMEVSMATLSDMMANAYFDNAGQTQKMFGGKDE